ncbi:MAG TPA: RIP metalloprotease RseP, partial [Burkholderiaceae bacterium]|nr:RIP metalloprotease RseP [Burkholderiaceae bacterium]
MISLLQTILAFLTAFGVLVVVHELGHYSVARLCGVKILRFSVGMGKTIFMRRLGRDQTEWAISALPLGGYVKMLDARDQDLNNVSADDLKREFTRQSVWKRIAIVVAGPAANFLLAIALFCGLYIHGVPDPVARLGLVPAKSLAANAGLRGGELITAVNGEPIRDWSELRWSLVQLAVAKKPAQLNYERMDGNIKTVGSAAISMDGISTTDLEGDFMGHMGLDLARLPILAKILPDGPAMRAGLHEGDLILAINNIPVTDQMAFHNLVRAAPGKNLQMVVLSKGQLLKIDVTPDAVKEGDQVIGQIKVGLQPPEMLL